MKKAIVATLFGLFTTSVAADNSCLGLAYYSGDRGFSKGEQLVYKGHKYTSKIDDNYCAFTPEFFTDEGPCADDKCAAIKFWDPDTNFKKGDKVQYDGVIYEALLDNFCSNPCNNEIVWKSIDTCYFPCDVAEEFVLGKEYHKNDIVQEKGQLYIAFHWANSLPSENHGPFEEWKLIGAKKCDVVDQCSTDCNAAHPFDATETYKKYDTVKYRVNDWDNDPDNTFLFCQQNDSSYCEDPLYFYNWKFVKVCDKNLGCSNAKTFPFAGGNVDVGDVVKHNGKLYFAKWWNSSPPQNGEDLFYGPYRYLQDC